VGPSDTVPTAPVTVAVALADKLDTLGTFWWAQELPTGSRDPYALRRAALGMIRIQLENALNFDVLGLAAKPITILEARRRSTDSRNLCEDILTGFAKIRVSPDLLAEAARMVDQISKKLDEKDRLDGLREVVSVWASLRDFTHERLQIALKDRYDVDVIRAASRVWETYESWGPEHPPKHVPDPNLVRITRRVEALSDFLATEDGATLLAGYKRAVNILKAEEKKKPEEADLYRLNPELGAMTLDEERALAAALRTEVGAVDDALAAEDFTRAMTHLAALRAPVDAFFDKVLVNDPDPEVRMNRLRLLTQVRDTANRVADFSLISG